MKPDTIFHEVYGVYYKAVAKIINRILCCRKNSKECGIDYQEILDIISETAFKESLGENSPSSNLLATAIDYNRYKGVVDGKIRDGKAIYETSLKHLVKMPITLLEKRWLKTISDDPRVKLFNCQFPNLSDVEPLYNNEDIYYTGQYVLGDDYNSLEYISNFKIIFKAVKEKYLLTITYDSLHEGVIKGIVEPQRLQYSIKENRFRLLALMNDELRTFNLSRMICCEVGDKISNVAAQRYLDKAFVEVMIKNNHSALERFLLYFANYERQTTKLENGLFKVKLFFTKQDETEVLINILSYIPWVKVIAPIEMKEKFLQRIKNQKKLLNDKTIEKL